MSTANLQVLAQGNNIALRTTSPREAVCQYMGWEFSEASDHRYHYGRTSAPIYSTQDGYVCAVKNGKKPPKYGLDWKEAPKAEWLKKQGQTIYIATGDISDE